MTAIALTYAEGHSQHGEILDWQDCPYRTPMEYSNPIFAVCLFNLEDGEQPVAIESFGPVSSLEFDTVIGKIDCPRVYAECSVRSEPEGVA